MQQAAAGTLVLVFYGDLEGGVGGEVGGVELGLSVPVKINSNGLSAGDSPGLASLRLCSESGRNTHGES